MQRQSGNAAGTGVAGDTGRDTESLAQLVLASTGHVVVAVGRPRSGKSEFVRQELLPRLPAGAAVPFDCASGLPVDAERCARRPGAIVILDSFDHVLGLCDAERTPILERLFATAPSATIVLVVNRESLPDLFELRTLVPEMLDRVFELAPRSLSAELPRSSALPGGAPPEWDAGLLAALDLQLASLAEATVTPALVDAIEEEFRSGSFDAASFLTSKHGLLDVLARHLERVLDRLPEAEKPDVRRAAMGVLKQVASTPRDGAFSLKGLDARLDVPDGTVANCYGWLVGAHGPLMQSPGEGVVFRPPQLGMVVQRLLQADRAVSERAARYVADGIEGRRKLGTLLPPERFEDVHAQRFLLDTPAEQAAFLALCALRAAPEAEPGAVDYWFRCIGDAGLQVATLVEALDDPDDKVRRRAAAMMSFLDEPRVQGNLCRAALHDQSARVRRAAADSLATFANTDAIRAVLEASASDADKTTRVHAIEALGIFPDAQCAHLLWGIVDDRETPLAARQAAIDALARTRCEAGVSALVRIGLHDADQEDRDRACAVLPTLGSATLTEYGAQAALEDWKQERAAPRPRRGWHWLWQWPGVVLILFLGLSLHGLPLLFLRRWVLAPAFFLAQIACVVIAFRVESDWALLLPLVNWGAAAAVGAWLARPKNGCADGFRRVLATGLLANAMLTLGLVLHPLGHTITGRKRQAWKVAGIEVVALLAMLPAIFLHRVFDPGIPRDLWDHFSGWLFYLYSGGGLVLSWLFAVGLLLTDERRERRGPWLSERHSNVLRALLRAPESAALVRDALGATEPERRRDARVLLDRFGDAVPGDALLHLVEQAARAGEAVPPEILRCLARNKGRKGYEMVVGKVCELSRTDGSWQDRAVELLARHPTDASIECLTEQRSSLRLWNRVSLWRAVLYHQFRGWHPTAAIGALAIALLLALLALEGTRHPSRSQIKELRSLSMAEPWSEPNALPATAEFLAKRYPERAGRELVVVFQEQVGKVGEPDAEVRAASIAGSLGMIASSRLASPEGAKIVDDCVGELVNAATAPWPTLRDHAWRSLEGATTVNPREELVRGLAGLFDKQMTDGGNVVDAGRAAALLASVAASPDKWPAAIVARSGAQLAARAEKLGVLLRAAPEANVRKQAIDALVASRADAAVLQIKAFVLSDPTARTAARGDQVSAGPDTPREEIDARVDAIGRLLAMQTPAALAAFADLNENPALKLSPEIRTRMVASFGRGAAKGLSEQAWALFVGRRPDEALTTAQAAVRADPQLPQAHATLGAVLYQKRDYDAALTEFRAATRLAAPNTYSYALSMEALVLKQRNDDAGAQRALGAAIAADPENANTYSFVQQIYPEPNKALVELLRLQADYPDVPAIPAQLSYLYHERLSAGDPSAYESAYEANRRVLDLLRPRDPAAALDAEINLAESMLTTNRHRQLLAAVPKLLARVGSNRDRQLTLLFLMLSAQVLSGGDKSALTTLGRMQSVYVEFVKSNQPQDWVYNGTLAYLAARKSASPKTEALFVVGRAVEATTSAPRDEGQPRAVQIDAFDRLRKALGGGQAGE